MATLAPAGRITVDLVDQEVQRLQTAWNACTPITDHEALLAGVLSPDAIDQLDRFDRPQLAFVIETCRTSRSLSETGRRLFAVSRTQRKSTNDADRCANTSPGLA